MKNQSESNPIISKRIPSSKSYLQLNPELPSNEPLTLEEKKLVAYGCPNFFQISSYEHITPVAAKQLTPEVAVNHCRGKNIICLGYAGVSLRIIYLGKKPTLQLEKNSVDDDIAQRANIIKYYVLPMVYKLLDYGNNIPPFIWRLLIANIETIYEVYSTSNSFRDHQASNIFYDSFRQGQNRYYIGLYGPILDNTTKEKFTKNLIADITKNAFKNISIVENTYYYQYPKTYSLIEQYSDTKEVPRKYIREMRRRVGAFKDNSNHMDIPTLTLPFVSYIESESERMEMQSKIVKSFTLAKLESSLEKATVTAKNPEWDVEETKKDIETIINEEALNTGISPRLLHRFWNIHRT